MRDDFAIFICTHERPNKQHTLKKLLSAGYTGKYFLLLDDEDTTLFEYVKLYGREHIYVFNKCEYIKKTDRFVALCDAPTKAVVYARNAAFDIAKKLGLNSFVVADDDIASLRHRYIKDGSLRSSEITYGFDEICLLYNSFLLANNFYCVSFGCVPNYFGGISTFLNSQSNARVCHNFIFVNAKMKFRWMSAFLEDMTTPFVYGRKGALFLSLLDVQLVNPPLGSNAGGMYDTYKNLSGFTRSFYSFICSPTNIRVYWCNGGWRTGILKDNSVPKIISSKFKKN